MPRPTALLLTLSSSLALASLVACGQKGPLVPSTGIAKATAAAAAPAASASTAGVR